ncbi:hypothetical protein MINT15_32380 [Saccharomonospora viridis]|uniref:Uncharacterized protein n=1 Tax=Saccharomonospora viridis TaxID=1852 RepID=A0A837DB58_9PSEU|nr:hypothetical protein MINT15_32380 [Saccharomonospora viridis]
MCRSWLSMGGDRFDGLRGRSRAARSETYAGMTITVDSGFTSCA